MKNITLSIDEEIYLAARRKAAERNMSLSRLVAEYLQSLSREEELRTERNRRLNEAFYAIDQGAARPPVGRLNRAEIYDADLR